MHPRDDGTTRWTRRRLIASVSGAATTGLAGCLGDEHESVVFDHPDVVRPDEPFGMTIDGLPEETVLEVSLE